MNAILITNFNKKKWVELWVQIIRSFTNEYFICVVDNHPGKNYFKEADQSLFVTPSGNRIAGDISLTNAGMEYLAGIDGLEFIVKTCADTWLFDETKLLELISRMKSSGKDFLSSHWEHPWDMAFDFFVISKEFMKEVFPIPNKHSPEIYLGKTLDKDRVFYWTEREPIHENRKRRFVWPELCFVTSHNLEENIRIVESVSTNLRFKT